MEIICYVETDESPVRWNADRSQYMTADFRWHNANGRQDWTTAPVADDSTICRICWSEIPRTGKPGRPATICPSCKGK